MEPVSADNICSFPGPTAARCPGYSPAAPQRWPDHLRYLPFINSEADHRGCAHLVAEPTSRGGFRPNCGHPSGHPATWEQAELHGRVQHRGAMQRRNAFAR